MTKSPATPFEKFKNNPIFIMGFPKSGTTLFLSLLDYHPQLLVFPEELKYFFKVYQKKNKYDALLNEVGLNTFQHKKITYPSGNRDYSDINYDYFKNKLKTRINRAKSDKEALLAVIETYYEVENSDKTNKKAWVEKSPLNEHYFPLLRKWFGDSMVCLHVIRNPLDNFATYRKKRSGQLTIEQFCLEWAFSAELIKLAKKLIKNYYVIEYEKLVTRPEEELKKICSWININYDKILLRPTRNGRSWYGNSMHGHKFYGISSKSIGIHKKLLNEDEINQIKKLLYGFNFRFKLKLMKRLFTFHLKWGHPKIYTVLKKYVK